ncbi:MAG: alpha/beta fold hydrolase [Candidatus Dormibacteraeota bacterium]|nr:alpha/beta fold hydrolase [Candidatus Dormibacteraeota bacterium]
MLIPGLGATRRVFDPLVPSLGHRLRVATYDQRGVGDSPFGAQGLTMRLMASDAVAVLDALGVERANVFGASMGGVVAQQLVVDHPHRVNRLLLAATQPPAGAAVPADPLATDALLGKGTRTPAEAYRRACTVLYSVAFQRTHQEFIDEQVRTRAAHPIAARVFTAQRRALATHSDVWSRLPSIAAPTLIMHGTADVVSPFENARLLAGRIPGAQTRWFTDCGHLFFHERPEESARVVHEFIRG